MYTCIISLPERKEDRLDLLIDELDDRSMKFLVWEATRDDNGVKGLLLTMQKLLRFLVDSGIGPALILEDDATFLSPNKYLLHKCIEQLPKDFDLFYLGGYLAYRQEKKYSENLLQIPQIYSTHAIVYSRKAMLKILEGLDWMFKMSNPRPYDQFLCNGIQKEKKCYCSFPMIMKQRSGYSDIQKEDVDYTKWHEKKFEEMTGHLRTDIRG